MFKMTSSPHTHSGKHTMRIMAWVIFAMLPALSIQWWYFGYGVLIQASLAISFALLLEWAVALLRKKPLNFYVSDFSGILTALILAMSIPPYAPYWLILIGIFFAIMIGKQAYGGLGQNVFNPAMVGYVVLLISFPLQMTSWLPPLNLLNEPPTFADAYQLIFHGLTTDGYSLHQLVNSIDGITQATPLDSAKVALSTQMEQPVTQLPIFQQGLPTGWWQVNLAFLCGGIFLILKKIIHWQIPVAMLLSFSLLAGLDNLVAQHGLFVGIHLLSGAMMFGAFFIATDPVTASITPTGKLIFGALVGLLIYVIRFYGNYPDGVAFAILLANITMPLIDYYTRPRVSGYMRKGKG